MASTSRFTLRQYVWLFDGNNRHYAADRSSPVYRKYFREQQIIAETRTSWILDGPWPGAKINKVSGEFQPQYKKDGLFGYKAQVYGSLVEVEDDCYLHEWRPVVSRQILTCTSRNLLKTIKRMLDVEGWKCPSCGAAGFAPRTGTRATGETFAGCDFCTNDENDSLV